MSPFLRIATETALQAGKLLLRSSKHIDQLKVYDKGPNDPVSNVDLECEKEIVDRLSYAYPDHTILTEEGAFIAGSSKDDASQTGPSANALRGKRLTTLSRPRVPTPLIGGGLLSRSPPEGKTDSGKPPRSPLPSTPSAPKPGPLFPDHERSFEPQSSLAMEKVSDMHWIIDPIDGTTNFIRGLSHCAISIALVRKQEIVLGLVYDPFKDEMFSAEKGEGATLNHKRIRVSPHKKIAGSVLATGIPYRPEQDAESYMKNLRAAVDAGANIRRMGAASLDLCYVACGRFDAFWESGLQPWDIAAGIRIVEEASGVCSDLNSYGAPALHTGNILASSPAIYEKMWELIQNSK